jgi:hypothetical protein
MTTHYYVASRGGLACGRGTHLDHTSDVNGVTCVRCLRSWAYRAAALNDEHRPAVREALDALLASAHRAAEEAGHCSTYDEIIEDIEVPDWYTIPPRKPLFEVGLDYQFRDGIKAEDEDEVYRLIAENPRQYLSVSKA